MHTCALLFASFLARTLSCAHAFLRARFLARTLPCARSLSLNQLNLSSLALFQAFKSGTRTTTNCGKSGNCDLPSASHGKQSSIQCCQNSHLFITIKLCTYFQSFWRSSLTSSCISKSNLVMHVMRRKARKEG